MSKSLGGGFSQSFCAEKSAFPPISTGQTGHLPRYGASGEKPLKENILRSNQETLEQTLSY
jgi:hypothetical protein